MSGLAILALITEAFRELLNGTTQERTAYVMRRKRELEAGQGAPPRMVESPVKPFSAVADDPTVRRSIEDEDL